MSLSSSIAPYLPYLRRFSRALAGSQQGGDWYVTALLEAMIAGGPPTEPRRLKIDLYRNLCELWNALPLNVGRDVPGATWESSAQGKLSQLPPRARQVFLLSSLEGFSSGEIQEILAISRSEFEFLMDEATHEITAMISTGVLIIEDEHLIALDLEDLVTDLGHHVTGIARTQKEAVKLAEIEPPGLILSDVRLADESSGIAAVHDIIRRFDNVPIIFITAYPERLLTGSGLEPAFVVTKPYLRHVVEAMISQALFFDMTEGRPAPESAVG